MKLELKCRNRQKNTCFWRRKLKIKSNLILPCTTINKSILISLMLPKKWLLRRVKTSETKFSIFGVLSKGSQTFLKKESTRILTGFSSSQWSRWRDWRSGLGPVMLFLVASSLMGCLTLQLRSTAMKSSSNRLEIVQCFLHLLWRGILNLRTNIQRG